MLLIKCPQCQASYRLAESLYRRKAAGYGVVITCRRCKTQIHLDEGALPPAAGEKDQAAPETPEGDVAASPAPETATPAPTSIGSKTDEPTTDPLGLPPPDPTNPDDDTTTAAVNALPNVAPKPAAPRPAGVPRPGAVASPVRGRRGGTLLGIPPPANPPSALVPANEAAGRDGGGDGWKPKLVALSPGLLGVQTATKPAPHADAAPKAAPHGAPPGAKPPPGPPHPVHAAPPASDEPPDSVEPISAGSVVLLDSSEDAEAIEPAPDSAMPISSVDYLSSPEPAPPVPAHAEAEAPAKEAKAAAPGKRLPQPPPTPHMPKVAPRVANDEAPSQTSAPKVSDLALESSPLALSQKKGEPKPRKRQQSGDLTDDLLSGDMSFDPAPALAPPDAAALTRAPVSSRPAAAGSSTKAPVAKPAAVEKRSSGGRGIAILLVMAAFGGVGYVLQHRAVTPEPPKPEPQAAVNVAPPETAAPPVETAAPAADTASAAPAEPSSAAPEASAPSPAPAPPPTGSSTPAPAANPIPAAAAATPKTPKPAAESPAVASEKPASTTPKPEATTTAAPTSPAVIEPRGAVGTDPFDVAAARSALDASAAQASGCRKEGDPSGVAVVTITFSQTGRVTTANISGPPFQATPTGGCIASTMRKTRVPAFAGEMVTVRKTVTIQ
jgi:cytoskeletal protein RodZ